MQRFPTGLPRHIGVPRITMIIIIIIKRVRLRSYQELSHWLRAFKILKSLHQLSTNIKKYFPSLDISSMDWVRNPFMDSAILPFLNPIFVKQHFKHILINLINIVLFLTKLGNRKNKKHSSL